MTPKPGSETGAEVRVMRSVIETPRTGDDFILRWRQRGRIDCGRERRPSFVKPEALMQRSIPIRKGGRHYVPTDVSVHDCEVARARRPPEARKLETSSCHFANSTRRSRRRERADTTALDHTIGWAVPEPVPKKIDGAKAILLSPRRDRLSTLMATPKGRSQRTFGSGDRKFSRMVRKWGVNRFR